jgi:pimeloyl-ACP methyl ester carboxylesterase
MSGTDEKAAAPHVTVSDGEVAGGGLCFRYREAGSGPALICLDGAERRSPMRTLLAERHRVVELFLPAASWRPTPAMPNAISEAIAALGIARFDLVARGAGAAIALLLALERPESMGALVLLGPTAMASNGAPAGGADEELINRLGQLKVPSLAAFGTKDPFAPVEAGRHYRARIPACNLVFVYDAGQAMEEERPEAVAALLLDFLERHELFLVRRDSDLIYP